MPNPEGPGIGVRSRRAAAAESARLATRFATCTEATIARVSPTPPLGNGAPSGGGGPPATLERRVQRIAAGRCGVVTRRVLRDAGMTDHQVDRLLRRGFLIPVFRGVFAVGRAELTYEGRVRAAVDAGGPRAAASHDSAGALLGVFPRRHERAPIHVTAPGRHRRTPGIVWHVEPLGDRSRTVRRGIPCVSVARALVGISGAHGPVAAQRAWSTASSSGALRLRDVAFEIEHGRGRAGVAAVRRLLERHGTVLEQRTRSGLERAALEMLRRRHVAPPRANAVVRIGPHVFEGDLVWPERRLIVELDAFATHGDADSFATDRARDAVLGLAGWRVSRLTGWDVDRRPGPTVDRIRALLVQPPLEPAPGAAAGRVLRAG